MLYRSNKEIHYEETLVYLFIGEVNNGVPNIFRGIQYESWSQHFEDQFYPILIGATSKGVLFYQFTFKVTIEGIIYPETVYKHDLCSQFSINGSDLLFGDLSIIYQRDESFLPKTNRGNFQT